jgi:DNA-binding HxlR family transcriptional regulator
MNQSVQAHRDITPFCPFYRSAVEMIGRKWSGAILRAMLSGTTQFSDFAVTIPGVSDRLISVRLKEFEAEGIVERIVIPDKPVRIHYRLTPKGEALCSVVMAISDWAEEWLMDPQDAATKQTD